RPHPPIGVPRPLPPQPIPAQQPGPAPRPPQQYPYPQRPGMPSRPPFGGQRPGGGGRPAATQRRDQGPRSTASSMPAAPPPVTRTTTLAEGMTVNDLADKLDVPEKELLT